MDIILLCLVLMGFGMVYVVLLRLVLVGVTLVSMKGIAKFDSILPQEAPKKKPAAKAGNDDENIALAIAVALN